MLPLWMLQQPRGYLGGFVLYMAIGVGVVGVLLGGFPIQQPAMKDIADYGAYFGVGSSGAASPKMTELIFPFLFVTIACGACSGFHGLVCGGTTSKQIAKESHCKAVGFGAMLLEGFVAVLALATVMIATSADLLRPDGTPKPASAVYGEGLARFLMVILRPIFGDDASRFARTFGMMAVATFVFDTLDVATRLGRYLLTELAQSLRKTSLPRPSFLVGAIAALLTTCVPLLVLSFAERGSYMTFWVLFGASNQLLAALTLMGVSVWLVRQKKRATYTIVPMLIVLTITLAALGVQIFAGIRTVATTGLWTAAGKLEPTVLNVPVAVGLLILALVFARDATVAARSRHNRGV
jgi:carbon starvation protein